MSERETFLAHTRSILWRTWSTSSEELASAAVDTLMGLGMLVPEGGANELARLGLLQNAQPAALSEAQVDALADAGNRALNEHYHEDLCHCRDWPESCASSGNYFAGSWDTAAFGIGMAAVIGAWESMRAPAEADELSRLRARVAELEALKPARFQTCRTCGAGYEYGQACATCDFKARMATETAVRPCGCPTRFDRHAEGCPDVAEAEAADRSVRAQFPLLAGLLAEDPHDSPLHHTYKTGRDFPEVPRA